MQAGYFGILNLRPRLHSRDEIDRQYRAVCRRIVRDDSPDKQRRLDQALVAKVVLRDPARQKALIRRIGTVEPAAPTAPARPRLRVVSRDVSPPVQPARPRPRPILPEADGDDHKHFARMVAKSVESGLLRMTARRRLMGQALQLGIGEFKANLIIAEVLHDLRVGRRFIARDVGGSPIHTEPAADADTRWLDLILAATVATALNAALLIWLFR